MLCSTSTLKVWIIIIFIWPGSYSYDFRCPDSSHWRFRSRTCESTQDSSYQCLFEVIKSGFKEFCGGNEIAREGFKYVLRPNPDQVECSPTRYQPFSFSSLHQRRCEYEKSNCNEVGQVVVNDGSTKTDRTCRCDYTNNYMFVIPPKNRCFCVPSEEDCSCYYKPCPENKPIMVADYRCVNTAPIEEQIMCSKIINKRSNKSLEGPFIMPDYKILLLWLFYRTPQIKYTVTAASKCEGKDGIFNVLKGDSVLICATVESWFQVKRVIWKIQHCGDNLFTDCPYRQTYGNTSSVQIDNVTENDQGIYKCVAIDFIGRLPFLVNETFTDTDQSYVTIRTFSPTGIHKKQPICYIGNEFEFEGSRKGEGYIRKLLLRKEGNGHYSVIQNKSHYDGWIIDKCENSNEGTYICLAINADGSVVEHLSFEAHLKVYPKDDREALENHLIQNKPKKVTECRENDHFSQYL